MARLAAADVFRGLTHNRRSALWHSMAHDGPGRQHPLFAKAEPDELNPSSLPTMSLEEEVVADYRTAGLSLRAHPLSFHRTILDHWNVIASDRLTHMQHRRRVTVAGLVILRQRPSTANGITFVTLEDEMGTVNLILHQSIWKRYYQVARRCSAWLAKGHVERKDTVIHVVVQHLEDLSLRLKTVSVRSRDFR